MNPAPEALAPFDSYARNYEESLKAGIKVSGEDSSFFAEHRVRETKVALSMLGRDLARHKVIDFGCGTGNATSLLQKLLGSAQAVGLDISADSLAVASRRFNNRGILFRTIAEHPPTADADLVFCNGVFHHIRPADRIQSVAYIHSCLKPGGVFAFWENNPWNPGVHYIMRAIPFDREANKIMPHAAISLLRNGGFKILRLRYFFVFPKPLAFLRFLEPILSRFPLGAQYQVIAVKEAQ